MKNFYSSNMALFVASAFCATPSFSVIDDPVNDQGDTLLIQAVFGQNVDIERILHRNQ